MMVADTPYFRVNDGLRSESVGNELDATMLCGRPNACPTSCVIDLAHRLAHQLFGRVERARGRVGCAGLDQQAIPVRPHVVVVPGDVTFDDLAAARVGRARPDGVADQARRPPHDGVANVFRIPVGIFLGRRCVLRDDRVLEAGLLERALPVLDALPSCTERQRVGVAGSR